VTLTSDLSADRPVSSRSDAFSRIEHNLETIDNELSSYPASREARLQLMRVVDCLLALKDKRRPSEVSSFDQERFKRQWEKESINPTKVEDSQELVSENSRLLAEIARLKTRVQAMKR
jgi:hypothetical protein